MKEDASNYSQLACHVLIQLPHGLGFHGGKTG